MDKFVQSLITIEKSIQIATLVGLILFLGNLGKVNYCSAHFASKYHARKKWQTVAQH